MTMIRMSRNGIGVICILIAFLAKCSGRHGMDRGVRDTSISCYECNSEYDPRCGDPFDPFTIGTVNCSLKRPLDHIKLKPTLCRKTVQRVQNNLRVIRGCGYIPDARDDKECILRTGTHDIDIKYCSCKTGLCNTAGLIVKHRPKYIIFYGLFLVIFFIYTA